SSKEVTRWRHSIHGKIWSNPVKAVLTQFKLVSSGSKHFWKSSRFRNDHTSNEIQGFGDRESVGRRGRHPVVKAYHQEVQELLSCCRCYSWYLVAQEIIYSIDRSFQPLYCLMVEADGQFILSLG